MHLYSWQENKTKNLAQNGSSVNLRNPTAEGLKADSWVSLKGDLINSGHLKLFLIMSPFYLRDFYAASGKICIQIKYILYKS